VKVFASTGPVDIRNATIEVIVKDINESPLNTVASNFAADGLYFSAFNQSAVYYLSNDDIHVDGDGSADISSSSKSDAEKYVSVYTPRGVAIFESGVVAGGSFEMLHRPELLFATPAASLGLGVAFQ
jgi:hypothetical protein|tara:strand:+ start:281 stop:661 length:381 start_codon:yes stop_codon:yes gene_type:complete